MDENELIVVGCPGCSQRFRVRQQSAGSAVQCPHCAQAVSVPTLTDPHAAGPTPQRQSTPSNPPAPKRPPASAQPPAASMEPFRLKPQPVPTASADANSPQQSAAKMTAQFPDPPENTSVQDVGAPFQVQGARRLYKRNELRVPKTFGAAFFALFDFRFRYYITPWIIRIQWALFVAIMLLVMAAVTINYLPSISGSSGESVVTETEFGTKTTTPTQWQFSPPKGLLSSLARTFSLLAILIFCVALMLSVRMFLESAIVFFRIAEDLSTVKEMASQAIAESEN